MEKKGKRQRLWSWLTNKYQLIIRNEENFAEKTTVSFNYAKASLFLIISFSVLFIAALFLSKTVLSMWFDPETGNRRQRKEIEELTAELENLYEDFAAHQQHVASFKIMLEGGQVLDSDTAIGASNTEVKGNTEGLAPVDSAIRKEFEVNKGELIGELERHSISGHRELAEMIFVSPISYSEISRKYNSRDEHFGIDFTSLENEPIKAVSDGTVIISSWTDDSGYVVGVQHKNNLVSFYKHNSTRLKKVGDFVKTGDIIGIVGNTGELTTGPHLHFEMWYNGSPINPEHFISL